MTQCSLLVVIFVKQSDLIVYMCLAGIKKRGLYLSCGFKRDVGNAFLPLSILSLSFPNFFRVSRKEIGLQKS